MEHIVLLIFLSSAAVCHGCCPDEWVTFRGSCYLFGESSTYNHTDAESVCARESGHLVAIETQEENAFLVKFLKRLTAPRFWIGLSDRDQEGTWEWANGSPLTFSYWAAGQPNSMGNEDCAIFWKGHTNHWDDVSCFLSGALPLCEKR